MLFSQVVGHEKIKSVLMSSVKEDRVGHAYIFEGPQGVGRKSMAEAFASSIMCENPKDGSPCGSCKSCMMCGSRNHPDVQIITNQLYDPSKKSTDVLVDTIRNMKKDVYIKPYLAEHKVYIVPNADTMNVYAQNSLLKVLEEPPEYCTIILIAENANMFLPTILSRGVRLKFSPIAKNLVEKYVEMNYPECGSNSSAIAAMSSGAIGRAKYLVENNDILELRNGLFSHIDALCGKGNKSIYDMTLFLKQNKENIGFITDALREIFRDLLYFNENGNCEKITNTDKVQEIEKIGEKLYSNTPLRMLEVLVKYDRYFSKNISYAQIAQCMSLELWEVMHDRSYRC